MTNLIPRLFMAAVLGAIPWIGFGQEMSRVDRQGKDQFQRLQIELAQAQRQGDEAQVEKIAAQAKRLLGDSAGVPETPDEFRAVPQQVKRLSADEIPAAFAPYLRWIEERRWWKVGLDPRQTPQLPREVAAVASGCLAARRAGASDGDRLLAMAKQAGDYLIWTQEQAGTGGIPFPAVHGGKGRALEVADRFLRRAEREGLFDRVVRNGWAVDDLGDGGLQFDNGLCGVSLFELYEATNDRRYLTAARATADWAVKRPVVSNWNYNSFSVYLLAKAFIVTQEQAYLDAAARKARLGIYPGQLTDGKHEGRWADPHNARPAYHYILVRGIAALILALPENAPDRKAAIVCLRRALRARNKDFQERGVSNPDSALEALLLVKSLPRDVDLRDSGLDEALDALGRYAAAGYRSRRGALSPGVWGHYLEFLARRTRDGSGSNWRRTFWAVAESSPRLTHRRAPFPVTGLP